MTPDRDARSRALDIERSFIVQAPAGSGKTELLIQRYLALLAHVAVPEQVLAMTFTRKAAAEMRHRVLSALERADSKRVPDEPHRLRTFELASAVVARDRDRGWNLAEQPARLRIETLDALNARLAQHLSVLSGGIGGATVVDQPLDCYSAAIRQTLASLGSSDPAAEHVRRVLWAVDGNVARLETLLTSLLPARDQWLPYLLGGPTDALRARLEHGLQRLIREILSDVVDSLPNEFIDEALAVREARSDLRHDDADDRCDMEVDGISLARWRQLPELFLTQTNAWRQRLTAREGFAASDGDAKQRGLDLIAAYRDDDVVREALARLRELPPPQYSDEEWRLLASLQSILIRLVAELKVEFAARNTTDFVDVALAAQQALGAVDEPSELLLALDNRVQHILVDEFQDTSHSQLRLLNLLTSGWERGDGRSLFLVGDPMQSIYRFRHADMSLFLKVWANGLEPIDIETLSLSSNFRSAPAVVDWVNGAFARIFPPSDDIGAGAAAFHRCSATRQRAVSHAVSWHVLHDDATASEIDRVTVILEREVRDNPTQSIAVLVRSRGHLHGLQQALRNAGLAARAVELEAPRHQQIVQDLLALTRALTHSGDRSAWLGALRAPWCGLTWRDLLVVAERTRDGTVWMTINDETAIANVSSDGRARIEHLRRVIAIRYRERWSEPFGAWIEETWRLLGGFACLDSEADRLSAEQFFDVLAEQASHGDLDDPAALEDAFMEPYRGGVMPTQSGIEIMTIHRAKGLEFDTVILLGLGRQPRPTESRALYWLERTADDGSEDLLLAPLRSVYEGTDAIAAFIRSADAERDRAERARLLYVAATRARDRLHLVATVRLGAARPPTGSLLEFLWDAAVAQIAPEIDRDRPSPDEPLAMTIPLRRVRAPIEVASRDEPRRTASARPEFSWARHAAVQIGTVVHNVLQEIGDNGLERYSPELITSLATRFRRDLQLRGVDENDLDRAADRVVAAVSAVCADPVGRWLLDRHSEAASELPITVRDNNVLAQLRIDRTFVDVDGRRWIIDFKTSTHEGGDIDAFLDAEVERYRDQLTRYAAAIADIDRRPIQVGLYFPLLQSFRSWQPDSDELAGWSVLDVT